MEIEYNRDWIEHIFVYFNIELNAYFEIELNIYFNIGLNTFQDWIEYIIDKY